MQIPSTVQARVREVGSPEAKAVKTLEESSSKEKKLETGPSEPQRLRDERREGEMEEGESVCSGETLEEIVS